MQDQIKSPDLIKYLVSSIKSESPTAVVSYLDFKIDPTGKNKKDPSKLELAAFTKFLELSTYRVTSTVQMEQIQDLRILHGVDANEMLGSTLRNESDVNTSKIIFDLMKELGEKSRRNRFTKFQVLLNKYLGYEPKETIGDWRGETSKTLTSKIFLHSQLIAEKSRRGPGNFVMLSPELCSILMDSPRFEYHMNDGSPLKAGLFDYIGKIGNIKVFRNLYTKDPEEIIMGRSMSEAPGILHVYMEPVIQEKETPPDPNIKPQKTIELFNRMAIVAVGNSPEDFYQRILISRSGKHNIFTHLIDLLKSKFKK